MGFIFLLDDLINRAMRCVATVSLDRSHCGVQSASASQFVEDGRCENIIEDMSRIISCDVPLELEHHPP